MKATAQVTAKVTAQVGEGKRLRGAVRAKGVGGSFRSAPGTAAPIAATVTAIETEMGSPA